MNAGLDLDRLDDAEALEALDRAGMLRATATAGAQVRLTLEALAAHQAVLAQVSAVGRPASVVVVGMGGSAMAGDVAAAAAGLGCPISLTTVRGYVLPGWVGALDLVIAVSCSGETEETLEVFAEAHRRGCRLMAIASPDSSLARAAADAAVPFLPIDAGGRAPRANMWALAAPVLAVLDALTLVEIDQARFAALADVLDATSARNAVSVPVDDNPAKQLALSLVGSLPMIWGTTPLTAAAGYRAMAQLAENADYPSVHGSLPEANHNQVVTLDGAFASAAEDALFRDRVDGDWGRPPLHLLLLRDADEHVQVSRRAEVSADLATSRGVAVTSLSGDGDLALERFASLVQMIDFASVYMALALGVDPSEIAPITELKRRIAR